MKSLTKYFTAGLFFLSVSVSVFAQCEILNRVTPDGSMQYYMKPINFYWTNAKSLKGCIVTDKENYFLELYPVPFPEKPAGKKLKNDLVLKLANGEIYKLKHYDTRYVDDDTVMEMLYLISKKDLEFFRNNEVVQADIDMNGNEGVRSYEFKLHKGDLKQQLECFLKEEEIKNK